MSRGRAGVAVFVLLAGCAPRAYEPERVVPEIPLDETLGQRPCAGVALLPEGATGVGEQHLRSVGPTPEEEDARAPDGHA